MLLFPAFWWPFLAHCGTLCYFLALSGSFGPFTLFCQEFTFVIIYALFKVKLFWHKPCLCKIFVFLHVCLGSVWLSHPKMNMVGLSYNEYDGTILGWIYWGHPMLVLDPRISMVGPSEGKYGGAINQTWKMSIFLPEQVFPIFLFTPKRVNYGQN